MISLTDNKMAIKASIKGNKIGIKLKAISNSHNSTKIKTEIMEIINTIVVDSMKNKINSTEYLF
jgi:hypothetical protein